LALESAYQLGWTSSSVCGLCNRWALCIDQTHCWNRTQSWRLWKPRNGSARPYLGTDALTPARQRSSIIGSHNLAMRISRREGTDVESLSPELN